jgi:hypothetical protein
MNRELRNFLKANINFATCSPSAHPQLSSPRKREPTSHRVKCAQGLARQDFSDQLHSCPIDYVPLLANKICERIRRKKRGGLAALLFVKCCHRFAQCRSIFGHAKRNCASEAYEPPLRLGMIVSSKAATSSNST